MDLMNDKVTVLDNFLPGYYEDLIETIVTYHSPFTIGSTHSNTAPPIKKYSLSQPNKNIFEQFQLCHTIINKFEPGFDSKSNNYLNWGHYLFTPLQMGLAKIGYHACLDDIIRIKLNLQTSSSRNKNQYNNPHIDVPDIPDQDKIYTAIYYINDNDGDTFLFNEPFGTSYDNLTIQQTISSKKGRLVIIPSTLLHAGSHPINSPYRLVANYNFYLIPLNIYLDT